MRVINTESRVQERGQPVKRRGICRLCHNPALVFGGTPEARRGRAVRDQVAKDLVQMLAVPMGMHQGRDAIAFCTARGTFPTAVTSGNHCVV